MKKILIAEDNDLNGKLLQELLRYEGYDSVVVKDDEKAFEVFSASAINEYSAILFDVQHLWSDCWATSGKIRNLNREDSETVCIYISTASIYRRSRATAGDMIINSFLSVPINPEEILSLLQRDI